MTTGFVFLLFLAVTIVVLIGPRHTNIDSECTHLIDKLDPGQVRALSDFADEGNFWSQDPTFWIRSQGIRGSVRRLFNGTVLLRLCRIGYRDGFVSAVDMSSVMGTSVLLSAFTLLTLPEAVLCSLWARFPHICARTAFHFYCQLSAQTVVLCTKEDAPGCVLRLPNLL